MAPQWSKKLSKNDPGDPPEKCRFLVSFLRKKAPQKDTKKDTKIIKNIFRRFFSEQKINEFPEAIFSFFEASGRSQTLKIELKRCTVVQKRGSLLFAKNCTFFKQLTNNDPPWDPTDIKKRRKT